MSGSDDRAKLLQELHKVLQQLQEKAIDCLTDSDKEFPLLSTIQENKIALKTAEIAAVRTGTVRETKVALDALRTQICADEAALKALRDKAPLRELRVRAVAAKAPQKERCAREDAAAKARRKAVRAYEAPLRAREEAGGVRFTSSVVLREDKKVMK